MNGVFKAVQDKLERENRTVLSATIIFQSSFLSNILKGFIILSVTQLAGVYSPSVYANSAIYRLTESTRRPCWGDCSTCTTQDTSWKTSRINSNLSTSQKDAHLGLLWYLKEKWPQSIGQSEGPSCRNSLCQISTSTKIIYDYCCFSAFPYRSWNWICQFATGNVFQTNYGSQERQYSGITPRTKL